MGRRRRPGPYRVALCVAGLALLLLSCAYPIPTATRAPAPLAAEVVASRSTPPSVPSPTPTPQATGPPTAQSTRPPTTEPSPTPPVAIHNFGISPPEIEPGGTVTLTWDAVGESVVIAPLSDRGMLTDEYYTVAPAGRMTLPTDPQRRGSVRFVLTVRSGDAAASADAAAKIRCPDAWFFADPPPDCPAPAQPATVVLQPFERGWMLRDPGAADQIVILFYRQPDDPTGGSREYVPDAWQPATQEANPASEPPAGYYAPVEAFGQAWRQADVRESLGWATAEAITYESRYQCDTEPKYSRCFVAGPDKRIFQLGPESGWELWR